MGAREKDLNPDVFIGLQLPLGYSNTGFFKQTKTTFEQAKYNIVNLFRTIPGERLGQPTFGSVLHEIIFEPMNEDFTDIMQEAIERSLEIWLPYINYIVHSHNISKKSNLVAIYGEEDVLFTESLYLLSGC